MNAEWWVNINELDADQKTVMGLGPERDYLVLGPPGSGKTNLLLLRANYLSRAGFPNVLVIVFGRTLKEFLLRGSTQYRFDTGKVTTSTKWYYEVLRQIGEKAPVASGGFDEIRTQLIEGVRAAISKLDQKPLYDAILLDEAQDFLPSEVELFSQLATRIFAVGDSNQKIYSGNGGIERLKERCTTYQLRHHYRNGIRICRFADSLGGAFPGYTPLAGESNYSEKQWKSSVEYFRCGSIEEQVQLIETDLGRQIKAYPGELLGVLCPRRVDVDTVFDGLYQGSLKPHIIKQSFEDGYEAFTEKTRVCVTTIHGSKGLEFRAVHASSLEHVRNFPRQRHLVFTLATRAKTSLSLYSVGGLPGYVEGAMVAVNPPRAVPPLESAFGEELE